MTMRQKILIATFFLGLVSLGVDCLFLRPREAAATAFADASQRYGMPSVRRDTPVSVPDEAECQSVAHRLDHLWPKGQVDATEIRDPFAVPGSWSGGPADSSDPLIAFARSHRLEAVVLDGRRVHALVGDQVLTPGQQIDGFTLVAVTRQAAVFERQGRRVTLQLAK